MSQPQPPQFQAGAAKPCPASTPHIIEMAELVAHEVNNLLNNILLHVAVMDRKGAQAVQPELSVIRQAATRAGSIINRWQQLAPRQLPELAPVDLNRLAGEAAASWKPSAHGPSVRFEPTPDLPLALAQTSELERLLQLLLNNAAGGMDQGTITLRTEATPSEVRLIVEDNGPALDSAELDRLFEPFFVARSTHGVEDVASQAELGLALCKRVARRQQGSIYAENRPDGGVRVVIAFRRAGEVQ